MSLMIGGLYCLCAFVLTSLWRVDVAIILFATFWAGLYAYSRYQEGYSSAKIRLASAAHALAHVAMIVGFCWLALNVNARLFEAPDWHWFAWLVFLAVVVLPVGSALGGLIFGLNLLITCRYFDMNHNDAFSAMKLDRYRNFLRLRVLGDTLTVYPVGLDEVPRRHQWRENPARSTDPAASVFVPEPAMEPHLIGGEPIKIHAREAPSTSDVKQPSELPTKGSGVST
jgi:hypothetical protein